MTRTEHLLPSELQDGKLWLPVLLAWLVSLISTLGSLFFSEVMKLPPCILCWYQRVGLFPLVLILTIGILSKDQKLGRYAWPFVFFGLVTAVYHNLLYYHFIPESISPCSQGASCTERQIEWFGFISIPLLSLLAFSSIGLSLMAFRHRLKRIQIA